MSILSQKSFALERPWHGLETAFAARWGNDGPEIAFLAEYDALPGYGPQGNAPGHACGHNWIAAATVGAALVLSQICQEENQPVRILLAGCPAEETFGSKSLLAREGAFAQTACALQPHLSNHTNLYHRSLALDALEIRFFGKAAHASAAPWEGINALDAIQLFYAGVNALRQQLPPDVRSHGIIREGGLAANSIPERASCLFYARAAHRRQLNQITARLRDIAQGAALMTGARLEITCPEQPMDDLIQIPALQKTLAERLAAEELFSITREEEAALSVGSTDVGNVSHVCPTCFVELPLEGFSGHTAQALTLVEKPAFPILHTAVRALAGTALEVVQNPALRTQITEEWRAQVSKN